MVIGAMNGDDGDTDENNDDLMMVKV